MENKPIKTSKMGCPVEFLSSWHVFWGRKKTHCAIGLVAWWHCVYVIAWWYSDNVYKSLTHHMGQAAWQLHLPSSRFNPELIFLPSLMFPSKVKGRHQSLFFFLVGWFYPPYRGFIFPFCFVLGHNEPQLATGTSQCEHHSSTSKILFESWRQLYTA